MIYVLDRVKNIVEKGENAGFQHFAAFPTMFSKALFLRVVKSLDCVVKVSKSGLFDKELKKV